MATDDERLEVLRSLDPARAMAYYNRTDPPNPHMRVNRPDKVLVRMHKERIGCADLTDEERQASRDWIEARIAKGR